MKARVPRNRRHEDTPAWWVRVSFVCALVLFALSLQFTTPNLGSLDGYFHIRYSDLLRRAGWRDFPPAFNALPFTILSADRYADHHMLFHLGLIPFTRGDLLTGAKLASAIGAAAAFSSIYLFLVWCGVRRAEWWVTGILALAPGFVYRMEMPRAQAWAVVCLVAALALLHARREAWLLPLACLFTWLYNAFPTILAVTGAFVVAERVREGRWRWHPFLYAAGGIGIGLLVNPYFPDNIRFTFHHFADKLWIPAGMPLGTEWQPFGAAAWIGWIGLLAILIGIGTVLYRGRGSWRTEDLGTALAAMVFLVMLWRATRFIEYFVPIAGIAVALRWHESVAAFLRSSSTRLRRGAGAALLVWCSVTAVVAAAQLRSRPPADLYRGASTWIRNHTSPGDVIFNVGWDDFPFLYFHNPSASYVIGLDPSYLASRDASRYRLWERLTLGLEPNPAGAILRNFSARVAIASVDEDVFLSTLDDDPSAERAYADDQAVVYLLRAASTSTDVPPRP